MGKGPGSGTAWGSPCNRYYNEAVLKGFHTGSFKIKRKYM